jgi:nucleoside-diphosphate-sugar epimerase
MAPSVLILGGVGFIGRHLVSYLVENNLVSKIRVADKVLPATAYLNPQHKKAFEDPKVEFKQANLVNAGRCLLLD